ncbi:unnamed protein product [Dovyalis caffra]|uniref:Wall-associated receptor kinase galacturonan-binding domain-containing protein n=1 Tax=Dovyalis caffra TaxID=77055 RepID=A0AAV1RIX4_9ROSI|nr:unnamed protein product [Dovyalis caffra]
MAVAPIARPNCLDSCGQNISIPFPFGIGTGCYLDKQFEIECNQTAKPPRAYIRSIKLEVVNISVDRGAAIVKGPIISFNSSGRQAGLPVNLTGTPFIFSYRNVFVAMGCNTRAVMTDIQPYLIGCESTCKDQSANVNLLGTDFCSGKNCCASSISSFVQVFNPRLEALDDNQGKNGRWWAFLASDEWFTSNKTDSLAVPYMDYVPMELFWIASNLDLEKSPVHCELRNDNRSLAAGCHCYMDSYEGNPYLKSGCTARKGKG